MPRSFLLCGRIVTEKWYTLLAAVAHIYLHALSLSVPMIVRLQALFDNIAHAPALPFFIPTI